MQNRQYRGHIEVAINHLSVKVVLFVLDDSFTYQEKGLCRDIDVLDRSQVNHVPRSESLESALDDLAKLTTSLG